jgi:hypothetical protein
METGGSKRKLVSGGNRGFVFFKKIGAYIQTLKSGEVGGGRAWWRRG